MFKPGQIGKVKKNEGKKEIKVIISKRLVYDRKAEDPVCNQT